MQWSPWQTIENNIPFTTRSLAETIDGGQTFRWSFIEQENCWQGIFGKHVARVRIHRKSLQASFPKKQKQPNRPALKEYLACDIDWTQTTDALPHRSDAHLRACIEAFPGLRLLNQPFDEALLAFLCSATKQIPQIKIMCENLANAHGSEILPGIHALPTWIQLSKASEENLRQLGLGFRAKNIKKTADLIAADPTLLDRINAQDYPDAKAALMQLPGVGAKIADCALLFGAQKYKAFPVDTWIIKVLKNRYGLEDWTNNQLVQFGHIHFGPQAGYAQQFLFAYERAQAR
jgi:N-glycosylase/DNA lyase